MANISREERNRFVDKEFMIQVNASILGEREEITGETRNV